MLKPGGQIAIADFYISRKYPEEGLRRHGWLTRNLVPLWFGNDNVQPSADHLPYLRSRFETVSLDEGRGAVPYAPLMRVPYYIFIGRKPIGNEISSRDGAQLRLTTTTPATGRAAPTFSQRNAVYADR